MAEAKPSKKQFSIMFLVLTTFVLAIGMCLVSTPLIEYGHQQNIIDFAKSNGGEVYFSHNHNTKTAKPSIFDRKVISFVDMSGTKLDDTQVPRMMALVKNLPAAPVLDVRCTDVSLKGLILIIQADYNIGLVADENLLVQLDQKINGDRNKDKTKVPATERRTWKSVSEDASVASTGPKRRRSGSHGTRRCRSESVQGGVFSVQE